MYTVVSTNEYDGTLVDEFDTLKEAEFFANDLSIEGFTCTICKMLRTIAAQTPENYNIGIDAPLTMQPQKLRLVA